MDSTLCLKASSSLMPCVKKMHGELLAKCGRGCCITALHCRSPSATVNPDEASMQLSRLATQLAIVSAELVLQLRVLRHVWLFPNPTKHIILPTCIHPPALPLLTTTQAHPSLPRYSIPHLAGVAAEQSLHHAVHCAQQDAPAASSHAFHKVHAWWRPMRSAEQMGVSWINGGEALRFYLGVACTNK